MLEKVFASRYLTQATAQRDGHSSAELDDLIDRHFALGRIRANNISLISVVQADGGTTAVDIVTSDAAYLVDSVRSQIEHLGHDVLSLLHPLFVICRGAAGEITEIADVADDAALPQGAQTEAWIHVEIPSLDVGEQAVLTATLQKTLTDVHLAVDDAPATYALARQLAAELAAEPGQFDRAASAEAGELLRWLVDGNCVITGHAAYSANELGMGGQSVAGELRGVLSGDTVLSPAEILPAFRSGVPLIIFKSPLLSRVLRADRYDCITVVTPGRDGAGQTVHVFLGLIVGDGDEWLSRVPVVRRRISEILKRSGVRSDSHSGRQLLAALRTLPRDELLAAPTTDLLRLAELVVDRAEQGRVGVFARLHLNRDFVTVLVYFPADRFGPETRRKVALTVTRHWPGAVISRDDRIVDLGLARMQFLIELAPGPVPVPDRHRLEAEVAALTRRWSDDLADLLTLAVGENRAHSLLLQYAGAFPEAYKENFDAATAVADVTRIDELPAEEGLAFSLYTPPGATGRMRRLKMYRTGRALSLARVLPILSRVGLEILDEHPYEINRSGDRKAWIYDFGLLLPDGVELDSALAMDTVDALRALWRGEIEQDGLNALVLKARLSWWQVNVLRAYVAYLGQTASPFSRGYVETALLEHPDIARQFVEYFERKFDPSVQPTPDSDVLKTMNDSLAAVQSLDQDRILRALLGLITATLRTNAYRRPESGDQLRVPVLSFKLDPHHIDVLPEPRPRYEIWVFSARVEGVHLRFGSIARGGLRWSDRREDFRTEVLGLVKAQMVKNAVIVPVGAKGGFVCKRLPDPQVDRDAWLAEGKACYRAFVRGMLDITDNYATDGSGRIEPPENVRRYDADDPYLVVAADKGTATFSDIANGICADRGFWLGDAFASGGSVGYDHKAMGITARGAWESVKYHFRDLGIDVQRQEFTVVGIGDMSGDVFGNAMLLSPQIRLVAAFDHRHIFLDPDPVAATSFAQRQRMFALASSSWADYDAAQISEGGGVYSRNAKSIVITPQVRQALGIAPEVEALAPLDLIRVILLAPVDLLFNGGIGTYVKASSEPNSAVGDKANDSLRVSGAQLRVRVVGEGGNLGFTQAGRIEFARAGGRINTDAIDNSAGVDTSDHEVNLKILLDRAVAAGQIPADDRNILLRDATAEVAASVLRDNYDQNVLLGVARNNAAPLVNVHARLIKAMEASGHLDRELEGLPSAKELAVRDVANEGLSSPELAVLIAYAKITLAEQIANSAVPDDPWFQQILIGYFPTAIAQRAFESVPAHPLRREIVTTRVVNEVVNRAGASYVFRLEEETSVGAAQAVRAFIVVREVFGLSRLWDDIEALDNIVSTSAQYTGRQQIRRLIDRATRWFVDVRFPIADVGAEIERYAPTVQRLLPQVEQLLGFTEHAALESAAQRLTDGGLPTELSTRISALLTAFELLDVVEIAIASQESPEHVAALYLQVSEMFRVEELLTQITDLERDDRWSALARAAIRADLYAALSSVTAAVLAATSSQQEPLQRLMMWRDNNSERVRRTLATISEGLARDVADLATLSVVLRVLRSLPTN